MVEALRVSVGVAVACQLRTGSVVVRAGSVSAAEAEKEEEGEDVGEVGRWKAARPAARMSSAMWALREMAASMASRVARRAMGGAERRAVWVLGRAW